MVQRKVIKMLIIIIVLFNISALIIYYMSNKLANYKNRFTINVKTDIEVKLECVEKCQKHEGITLCEEPIVDSYELLDKENEIDLLKNDNHLSKLLTYLFTLIESEEINIKTNWQEINDFVLEHNLDENHNLFIEYQE